MGLIVAFAVLIAGAVVALRSAFPPATKPAELDAAPPEPAPEEPALVAPETNGAGSDAANLDAALDPEATLTAAMTPVPAPPLMTPVLAPPPVPAVPRGSGSVALRARTLVIGVTEDRRLDELLADASEEAEPARHPTLRLLVAIAALGLAFAGAILIVARGVQALFGAFF